MGFVEDLYGPEVVDEQPTNIYNYQNTPENKSWAGALPVKQGLYDPEYEKDACGVGFAAYVLLACLAADTANRCPAISRVRRATRLLAMVCAKDAYLLQSAI